MSIPKECLDRHRILAFHHTEESDQAFFETNSNVAINYCVEKIFKKNLEEKGLNPAKASSCFDKTITFTSSFRNKIALRMEEKFAKASRKPFDPDSCPFGVSRLKAEMPTIYEVVLGRSYETTGNKVAQIIARDLQDGRELSTFTGNTSAKSCEAAAKTASSSMLFDDENHLHLEMNWKVFNKEEIDGSVKDCTKINKEDVQKNPELMTAMLLKQTAQEKESKSFAESLITTYFLEIVDQRKQSNPALF